MEGSFACPECGTSVELAGLAPGRQVRCHFCHRLLEVPYLPRTGDDQWKRRRFRRPTWIVWSWAVLAIAGAIILCAGSLVVFKRHRHSSQERSIHQLLESSRRHESAGRLSEALLDLDAALELAGKADAPVKGPLDQHRHRREDLARRDAVSVVDRLSHADASPFPLGDWLNLMARADKDPDLKGMVPEIRQQFQASLERAIAAELKSARTLMEAARIVPAIGACDQAAALIKHLAPPASARVRREAEDFVSQLVNRHGVSIELPEGEFTFGSQSAYVKEFVPILVHGLEARGYLPYRESSPWKALWDRAQYRVHLKVVEQLEGNYLSSANRLTRIVADLTLTSRGEVKWHTSPTARTTVPLPKLSALLAGRVASSDHRSEEFERMLYADARGHIDEKLAYALSNMPQCP
ncbi:MAG: hypothetical protein ACLQIB_34580 [Isosphaeraceae bacterium]